MNLYILKEVLYDYTPGMVIIAAESMSQCEQIFIEEFEGERHQEEFNSADIKVIEGVNHPAGIISYVYGGG